MSEVMLDVRDLHAWYGESHILHGVDLRVHKGETVTLLGRNGAGKTTTLKAILGLVRKRQGTAMFRRADLMKLPLHHVARQGMGYVPEERGIFASLTVHENLLLPPVVAGGGHTIEEIFELFPNLRERRNSVGTKLSGGEQQMLAIARVLRTGVDTILLDEPTEGLAPVIVERIGMVLERLKAAGLTILLVEQNFAFASSIADRFYVMEEGRAIDTFDRAELPARLETLHETLGL